MSRSYSQEDVNERAISLRRAALEFSSIFGVAYGFDHDTEAIKDYIAKEENHEDYFPDLKRHLEEAEHVLRNAEMPPPKLSEEERYREMRRIGDTLELTDTSWRWSDSISYDHSEVDGVDYRPLIAARNDVVMFAMNYSDFYPELNELVPEIKGDDAEIIEEGPGRQEAEETPLLDICNQVLTQEDDELEQDSLHFVNGEFIGKIDVG